MKHKRTTELRYPGLWRGCVFAAAPCLGPTGLTLRDWSGFGQHGMLTNMDAGTDWVTSAGRYALDFDGTNDFVTFPSLTFAGDFSASFWLSFNSLSSNRIWASRATGGFTLVGTLSSTTSIAVRPENLGELLAFTVPTMQTNVVYNVLLTRSGSAVRLFLNGLESSSGALSASSNFIFDNFGYAFNVSFGVSGRIFDTSFFKADVSHLRHVISMRPGIAFELAPRRRSSVLVAAAFNRRRRLLVGAGS